MNKGYILNKREVVMEQHERQESGRHVYFQFGNDDDEHREGYYLTRVNYEDMGEPGQITVTVVPGNMLADVMCPDIMETGSYS